MNPLEICVDAGYIIDRLARDIANLSMEAIMEIERAGYLRQLIDREWNGQIKVITGIRRCGKSFLLRTLVLVS